MQRIIAKRAVSEVGGDGQLSQRRLRQQFLNEESYRDRNSPP